MNGVYAFKNLEITDSSSGAAFPSIISALENIYSYKGETIVVYGAIFDDNMNVVYERAVNPEMYQRFRGSKYVKASLNNVLGLVEKDLNAGRVVLFSGIPCQIDAIKRILIKRNVKIDHLYLIDLICHGAPQKQYFDDFIKWLKIKYKSEVSDFSFRYQAARWKSYPVRVKLKNGKIKINSYIVRQYTDLFFTGLLLSEGCYHCKYSNTNRISDITIGDFWGINHVMPDFPYRECVSEIIINTDKGKLIMDKLLAEAANNSTLVISECIDDSYIQFQHNLSSPTNRPSRKEQFDLDYKENGFEYVLKKYGTYNFRGFIKYCIVRFRAETGMNTVITKMKNLMQRKQ